eukprot:CAMPEP_0172558010 /NCGR_PEP_ID=MMETSP1067-20121228/76645_1 /TAXON_ID=265564 ORGANISM="Thalassiosira punctigera, Strain Tpunct2005C2" /NCGR_SAMPLE_ID=MMETSP1067 /ASSEMBLY_ACC=CAM_ASM_000444 /LENGTH=350 /DNA_ID=CAMNT_0013347249 /DNA_START=34 /DNA_END=1086 /DNA_ORIENTATION=+
MAQKRTRVIAVLIAFGVLHAVLDVFQPYFRGSTHRLRRSLSDGGPVVYPWARNNLRPLDVAPEPDKDAVLVWHIPKSGGHTVKSIYECMGQTLANRAGVDPRYGHQLDEEIIAFQPYPGVSRATFVNVDTTNRPGIDRAKQMGLVPSGLVDIIVTSEPKYAIENLFDGTHKGRVLALFRHPVDRLVSKFFYLREATWEKQYRPQWKRMGVLEFAKQRNTDNNYMVKKLAALRVNDAATEEDLRIAMRTIKKRFIVGLVDHMAESVHRFNIVLGIDESQKENRKCMEHFLHDSVGARKHKSKSNPKVEPGSATWNAFAKRNSLDIRLYEFVVELFSQQKEIIESYETSYAG